MSGTVFSLIDEGRRIRAEREGKGDFQPRNRDPHPLVNSERGAFCKASEEEQARIRRGQRFTRELAVQVSQLEDRGANLEQLETFVRKHQLGYQHHEARRLHSNEDPPCKNWRQRLGTAMDPALLAQLDSLWSSCVESWAIRYHYLASPTARCECRKCGRPSVAKVRDRWGFDEPMRAPG